jgi:polyhydroxybutyrate depolymerase
VTPNPHRRRLIVVAVVALVALGVTRAAAFRRTRPLSGTSVRQLVIGGVTRTYLLRAGGEAKPDRPLLLVLHGLGGTAAALERRTRGTFDKLGDEFGAVIVYPQALGYPQASDRARWGAWSVGQRGTPPPPDDLGFLSALIDALAGELAIDRKRVYAAGFSNGAMMVYRLACERPDLVAAVAPVSGGMMPDVGPACGQGAPVSILGIHGTADPIVPLDASIRDGVAAWAKRDGCPAQPSTSQLPDADPTDGTLTHVDVYAPCAAGTAVAFYRIEDGGHAWPGEDTPGFFRRAGNTPRDFDAGRVIWEFFMQHPKR